MADFTIDGRKLKAEKGSTILQIARDNGIKIPTLCSNDGLEPYGACRLCVVEVKRGSMVSLESSCTYIAEEGMEIKTDSPAVISARKFVLQLLLARCPNVKIIQDLAEEYGIKKPVPYLSQENEYCILCGLCVRACNEVVQAGAISFAGNGKDKKVESPFGLEAENCIGCGSCAFVCPTGIIKIREIESAAESTPEGENKIGPERMIENWNRNLKMQTCLVSKNPFAPEFMLSCFKEQMSLPGNFFNISPSYREYPEIDEDMCVGCGECVDECPVGAIRMLKRDEEEFRSNIMTTHCCGCRTCTVYCVRGAIKVAEIA